MLNSSTHNPIDISHGNKEETLSIGEFVSSHTKKDDICPDELPLREITEKLNDNQDTAAESASKNWRIYYKSTKAWFDVSREEFEEYKRACTKIRKSMQYRGLCKCTFDKEWLCDGCCDDCEFRVKDNVLSLDEPIVNSNGDSGSLLDAISDGSRSVEEIALNKVVASQLLECIEKLYPGAIKIGKLRLMGMPYEEIAQIIDVPRTTILSRLKTLEKKLSEEYPGCL